MKKNHIKLILDVVMSVLLILMFKKNVISIAFHEIGGIFVCVLFIAHHLLNKNWIAGVTKKLFNKKSTGKAKFQYFIDVLLLIDFLAILVTGIGINKTLSKSIAFLGRAGNPWQFFTGGLSLILTGIHVGLHWSWIKGTVLGKAKNSVNRLVKIISGTVLAGFMGAGIYFSITTNLKNWLTRLFITNGPGKQAMRKLPGGPRPGGHPPAEPVTFLSIMKVFLAFLSILILVSAVTSLIEYFFFNKTRKQQSVPEERKSTPAETVETE